MRAVTLKLMLRRESNRKRIATKKLKKPGLIDLRPRLRKKMERKMVRRISWLERNVNRLRKHQKLLKRTLRPSWLKRSKNYPKSLQSRQKKNLRQSRNKN